MPLWRPLGLKDKKMLSNFYNVSRFLSSAKGFDVIKSIYFRHNLSEAEVAEYRHWNRESFEMANSFFGIIEIINEKNIIEKINFTNKQNFPCIRQQKNLGFRLFTWF